MNSILTNNDAAVSLLRLNATNKALGQVQERISSGQKVATARDNASTFAIATGMRSDVAVYKTVKENLSLGKAVIDSSLSAATQISSEITKIKAKIAQAADQPQGRELIQADIDNSLAQISAFVNSATFNGVNLIDGTGAAAGSKYKVSSSLDRDSAGNATFGQFSFDYHDLSTGDANSGLGALKNLSVNRQDAFDNDTSSQTANVTEITAALEDGETMTFSYVDAKGDTRTLTHTNNTGADYADGDATWDAFLTAHEDTLTELGFTVSGTGDTRTITRADGSKNSFAGITGTGAFDQETSEEVTLDFSGKKLQLDDTLNVNYAIGGTTKTLVLKVSNSANGAGLGTDDDGNTVLSLNVDDVGGAGVTAQAIATAVREALDAHADFDIAGAGAGVLGLSAAGSDGTLTLSTDPATATDSVTSVTQSVDFDSVMGKADEAEQVLKTVLGALGSASQRIESQQAFADEMIKSMDSNIGTLVDADMAEEAARLQALQTKQQLGMQALSIANQAPQMILQLFR